MRALSFFLALGLLRSIAFADTPAPLARFVPPTGTFFDDPIALSPDGTHIAVLTTDAGTQATLEVIDALPSRGGKAGPPPTLAGMPTMATRVEFLGSDRILVVGKREDGRLDAVLVTVKGATLVADKRRIGPADSIEGVTHDGKPAVCLYEKRDRKGGAEHGVTLVAVDGRTLAKKTYAETSDGLVRTRLGLVRPLWWSDGHTKLAAQKIGQFDKQKDMRQPDRFVRIDVLADKIVEEHEIEDLMAFTKIALAHKATPGDETFVRLAEDHRALLVVHGLTEAALPLGRDLNVYDTASVQTHELGDHELLVAVQVDANNVQAVERRVPDKDDLDVYKLDLGSLKQGLSMPRVLVLPGQGRPARIAASTTRLLVLRKDRGFDRGGVAVELFALP